MGLNGTREQGHSFRGQSGNGRIQQSTHDRFIGVPFALPWLRVSSKD